MPTKYAADDALPPSAAQVLLQMGAAFAQAAVECDVKHHFKDAIFKYTRAAEVLLDFLRVNTNPLLQAKCAEKVQEYVARAKFLAARPA